VLLFKDNLEVLVCSFGWTCGALGILDGIMGLQSMKQKVISGLIAMMAW